MNRNDLLWQVVLSNQSLEFKIIVQINNYLELRVSWVCKVLERWHGRPTVRYTVVGFDVRFVNTVKFLFDLKCEVSDDEQPHCRMTCEQVDLLPKRICLALWFFLTLPIATALWLVILSQVLIQIDSLDSAGWYFPFVRISKLVPYPIELNILLSDPPITCTQPFFLPLSFLLLPQFFFFSLPPHHILLLQLCIWNMFELRPIL